MRYDLRVLDFSNFSVYDKNLHQIVAKLRVYGEHVTNGEMIEKNLSTFSTTSAPLAQNMRYMKIKKYARSIQQLLLAESQYQTLVRNNEIRPPRKVHKTQVGEPKTVELAKPATTPTIKEGVGEPKLKEKEKHVAEAHAAEASRWSSKGSFKKSNPK